MLRIDRRLSQECVRNLLVHLGRAGAHHFRDASRRIRVERVASRQLPEVRDHPGIGVRQRHSVDAAVRVAEIHRAPVRDIRHRERRDLAQQLVWVERGAKDRAALGEEPLGEFGTLVRREVLDHVDGHDHPSLVSDRGRFHRRPALLAGRADAEPHQGLATLSVLERPPARQPLERERLSVLVEHLEAVQNVRCGRRQQRLARFVPERRHRRIVREQQAAVGRLGGHGVGNAAQDRFELIARLARVSSRQLLEPQQLVALGIRLLLLAAAAAEGPRARDRNRE